MNRRHKLLLMVVLAGGFVALGGYLVWPHEPTYGGRGLSAWLRDFDLEKMEKRVSAADAVKHIGPKTVPFLVERLKLPIARPGRESQLERWKRNALEWLDKAEVINKGSKSRLGVRFDHIVPLTMEFVWF